MEGAMPRDEWGNLRIKDRMKKAVLSGHYDRIEPVRKKHKLGANALAKQMKQNNDTVICKACGPVLPTLQQRTFQDGSKHIAAHCPNCTKFLKWIGR
jgi:hypothetical protein